MFTMSSLSASLLQLLCFCGLLYLTKCEWIDLSYPYNNETLYWGTSTRFQLKKVHVGPLVNASNVTIVPFYSAFDYSSAEHGGTHIDAPIHFAKGAWSVDEIPTENLVGDAVVVDISAKAAADRNYQLAVEDLTKWEENNGNIPDGSILLVYTDWGKRWGSYERYFGTSTTNALLYRFPGIHENAARWLVKNRKIKAVGIDTASIDYGKSASYPAHQILYAQNIYGIENVANLDKLPVTGAIVYALPMKIENGSGAPVRILATMASGARINRATMSGVLAVVLIAMALLNVF